MFQLSSQMMPEAAVFPSHLCLSGLLSGTVLLWLLSQSGARAYATKPPGPPKASISSHYFHFPGVGVIFFPPFSTYRHYFFF